MHDKVLATCVVILGAQPSTIFSINEMLCMSVNRDYIRAKKRGAYNFNSHQLEQLFATTQVRGMFHDTVFNKISKYLGIDLDSRLCGSIHLRQL